MNEVSEKRTALVQDLLRLFEGQITDGDSLEGWGEAIRPSLVQWQQHHNGIVDGIDVDYNRAGIEAVKSHLTTILLETLAK